MVATAANAVEVSLENAAAAAKYWLEANASPLGEPVSTVTQSEEAYKDSNGQALYYVISLDPAGFVIVAGDDTVEPVIAFARRGQFDPSPANPLGALVGPDLRERMAQVRQPGLTTNLSVPQIRARKKWTELRHKKGSSLYFYGLFELVYLDVALLPLQDSPCAEAGTHTVSRGDVPRHEPREPSAAQLPG